MLDLKIFKGFELFGDEYPKKQVKYAMEHPAEAIPEMLAILDHTLQNAQHIMENNRYRIHLPAIFLLALFREKAAYEDVLRLATLPDELTYDILGDVINEDFSKILASVCDGNIEPIKCIIENDELEVYIRTSAVSSLVVLMNNSVVTRDVLIDYFKVLIEEKTTGNPFIIDEVVDCCCRIHPLGLTGIIKKTIEESEEELTLDDEWALEFLEEQSAKSVKEVLEELAESGMYDYVSKEDVLDLEDWVCDFSEQDEFDFDNLEDGNDDEVPKFTDNIIQLPVRQENHVGRNDPCPCGSGKKYKKCCMDKEKM